MRENGRINLPMEMLAYKVARQAINVARDQWEEVRKCVGYDPSLGLVPSKDVTRAALTWAWNAAEADEPERFDVSREALLLATRVSMWRQVEWLTGEMTTFDLRVDPLNTVIIRMEAEIARVKFENGTGNGVPEVVFEEGAAVPAEQVDESSDESLNIPGMHDHEDIPAFLQEAGFDPEIANFDFLDSLELTQSKLDSGLFKEKLEGRGQNGVDRFKSRFGDLNVSFQTSCKLNRIDRLPKRPTSSKITTNRSKVQPVIAKCTSGELKRRRRQWSTESFSLLRV